jgi:hypothetical protein
MISAQTRRILERFGWVFVAYHTLIGAVLLASAFQGFDPGYWHRTEFQLELLFVVLIYPALIPALFVCGGLHDHCTTVLGHAVQATVFLTEVAWYLTGGWVLASFVVWYFRRSTNHLVFILA